MLLLRKITYGEFSEFIREKKLHITMLLLCSVLNRQKKPLDGKSGGKEGREAAGGGREWLLDFMFQLYVDGRGTVSNQHMNVNWNDQKTTIS